MGRMPYLRPRREGIGPASPRPNEGVKGRRTGDETRSPRGIELVVLFRPALRGPPAIRGGDGLVAGHAAVVEGVRWEAGHVGGRLEGPGGVETPGAGGVADHASFGMFERVAATLEDWEVGGKQKQF